MTDEQALMELTGLERFSQLEDRIFRVVESFKALRMEQERLQTENQKLKVEVEALQHKEAGSNQNIAKLQEEREALRERVEKALSLLATLDVH